MMVEALRFYGNDESIFKIGNSYFVSDFKTGLRRCISKKAFDTNGSKSKWSCLYLVFEIVILKRKNCSIYTV